MEEIHRARCMGRGAKDLQTLSRSAAYLTLYMFGNPEVL